MADNMGRGLLTLATLSIIGLLLSRRPREAPPPPGPSWVDINTLYYLPSQDDADNLFLQQASTAIASHLGQAGKTLSIDTTTAPQTGIYLLVDPALPSLAPLGEEAFWLISDSSGVRIYGKTPLAIRHGAFAFLERLGFRWFFKSPAWKIVPQGLPEIGNLNEVQDPHYIYRQIWHAVSVAGDTFKAWKKWNRLDGAKDLQVRHSYDSIVPPFDPLAPPEVYCPSSAAPDQLDPENPYVVDRAIQFARAYLAQGKIVDWDRDDRIPAASASISPNDGRGWCWGDPSGESQTQLITDKVYGLVNQVARAIQAEFPGAFAGIYSYSVYSDVPSFNLEPNVLALIATAFDITALSNLQRIQGLRSRGAMVGIREYIEPWDWFEDLPRGITRAELDQIKWYAQNGVTVYVGEGSDSWGAYGPLMYAASKLFWDPGLDYNTILDDFFTRAFGPARDTVKRYYERWFQGQSVTDRTLALSFQDLDEAERLASGDEGVLRRVRFLQYHVRYMWQWTEYRRGSLTLEEKKAFYRFLHRIRDLYVVFHRFPEEVLRNDLVASGVTPAELVALQDVTLPSPTEARVWMDEALLAFSGLAIDIDIINIDTLALVPLAMAGQLRLVPSTIRDNTVMVMAQAGDTVQARVITASPFASSTFSWVAPDGTVLETRTVPGTRTFVPLSFFAPVAGRYTMRGSGTIDVVGHPAAAVNTSSGVLGQKFYLYVSINTKGLVIEAGTSAFVRLWNPSGVLALDATCPGGLCWWGIAAPAAGLWMLEWGGTSRYDTGFRLMGVPPLVWHDAEYLLVPQGG